MEVRINWKPIEGGSRADYTAESIYIFFTTEEVAEYDIGHCIECTEDGNRLTMDPMILHACGYHTVAHLIDEEVLRQQHLKDEMLGIRRREDYAEYA